MIDAHRDGALVEIGAEGEVRRVRQVAVGLQEMGKGKVAVAGFGFGFRAQMSAQKRVMLKNAKKLAVAGCYTFEFLNFPF